MYQKYLSNLHELEGLIRIDPEMQAVDLNTCDVDTLKHLVQQNKVIFEVLLKTFSIDIKYRHTSAYFHLFLFQDTESNLLREAKLRLEDTTFDIQCFISEHAQFLSAAQSSCLLKLLSTTQRTFRDQTERLVAQRRTLDVLLDTRERENHAKVCLLMCSKISQRFRYTCLVCLTDISSKTATTKACYSDHRLIIKMDDTSSEKKRTLEQTSVC